MKKITASAVRKELDLYPAYKNEAIGLGIEKQTERNQDQTEQRWFGLNIRRGEYSTVGVGADVHRVHRVVAELLRHGETVRVYLINEVTYPTTISAGWLTLAPGDFA